MDNYMDLTALQQPSLWSLFCSFWWEIFHWGFANSHSRKHSQKPSSSVRNISLFTFNVGRRHISNMWVFKDGLITRANVCMCKCFSDFHLLLQSERNLTDRNYLDNTLLGLWLYCCRWHINFLLHWINRKGLVMSEGDFRGKERNNLESLPPTRWLCN